MSQRARNFRDYKVWQDAVSFATLVYQTTAQLPWFEKKGLCDQLQRAVVAISSNIAEGSARFSDAEFCHFLDIALGSSYEVETQLQITLNIGYITQEQYDPMFVKLQEIEKQISGLIRHLRPQ